MRALRETQNNDMAVLLVLCDPEDSENVGFAIGEYGESFRLSRANYLLHTERHRDDVWSDLRRRPETRAPDSVLVVPIQDPFRTLANGEVKYWLQRVSAKDPDNNEPFL